MAKGWKCARCGTENQEPNLTCSNCRLIRGAVWVPTTQVQQPPAPPESPLWGPQTQDAQTAQTAQTAQAEPMSSPAEASLGPAVWAAGVAPAAPAQEASPLWRRIPLNWVVIGLVAVATVVGGWFFSAGRGATGEITKAGDLQASELRVGDCFDLKDPDAEELDDVAARPCTSPHEFELYFVAVLPAGPYPNDAAFDAAFETQCMPSFATYVGKPYEQSALDVYWLVPTQVGWEEGDRSVQCAVYSPNDNQLTYSLKGSGF